jgi:6-phosphogluconolactonase (cycloisomerase 2 family)
MVVKPLKKLKKGGNMKTKVFIALAALILIPLVGTSWAGRGDTPGAVYAMTNTADGNEIVIFDRDANGMLTKEGSVPTGGTGSDGGLDPLGSQGSLILSLDHRWLLAVNAGSDEISVFRVLPDGLALVDKVSSGGDFPVSLAIFHDLVYVLNAGVSPNITGFILSHRGELIALAGSTRSLGTGAFAQVGFDPQGKMLVVTDRADNEILVYGVGRSGLPSTSPVTSKSSGLAPFGFIFDWQGNLLVAEAGSGAVSSYHILHDRTLRVISPSVANGQMATCWITGNRQYAFTSNTGSGTLSAYSVKPGKGSLVLLDANAGSGNKPIDSATSGNGRFLYVLDPGDGSIGMFRIKADGSLVDLGAVDGGFSIFAQGIAAR